MGSCQISPDRDRVLRGRQARAAVLACLLGLLLPASPDGLAAQTEAEVAGAVDRVFTRDGSRERLAEWGDAAVPVLAALLEQAEEDDLALMTLRYQVLEALKLIDSPAAAQLVIAMLGSDDIMSYERQMLLAYLESLAADPRRRDHVAGETFRDAVLSLAADPPSSLLDGGVQLEVIGITAHMRWTDQVPRLESLLDHDDVELRAAAADALQALTGEAREHDPLPLEFPAQALDDDLVTLLGTRPCEHLHGLTFGEWAGGSRLLVPTQQPNGIAVLDAGLEVVQALPLDGFVEHVVVTPGPEGGRQLMCTLEVGVLTRDLRLLALDEQGRELWQRPLGECAVRALEPRWVAGEIAGVLAMLLPVGGDARLDAFDLDGHLVWSAPGDRRSISRPLISTHPDLGDRVYVHGADETWVLDGAGQPDMDGRGGGRGRLGGLLGALGSGADSRPERFVQFQALPFTRGGKREARIVAGHGEPGTQPLLARRNLPSPRWAWSARLPVDARGLCLLEPDEGPRLVVAALASGEFLVFDEHGVLVHRGRFAETRLTHGAHERSVFPGVLRAGRLGEGLAFVVEAAETVSVFRVTPR